MIQIRIKTKMLPWLKKPGVFDLEKEKKKEAKKAKKTERSEKRMAYLKAKSEGLNYAKEKYKFLLNRRNKQMI